VVADDPDIVDDAVGMLTTLENAVADATW